MLSYTQISHPDPDPLPPFLTVSQVQNLLQLGRGSIYRQIELYFESDGAEGIPAVRIGRSIRVPRHALITHMSGEPSPNRAETKGEADRTGNPSERSR